MKVAVTGANGFVGAEVCKLLALNGIDVVKFSRNPLIGFVSVGHLHEDQQWQVFLNGVDCIIHTAARVHVMKDLAENPLEEFLAVNTRATLNLAKQAADIGVKRFIFISSIGVNGQNSPVTGFSEKDTPLPHSPYAVSKYEAEKQLLALAKNSSLEVIIIRPPLIYGKSAPGNIEKLMQLIASGLPLPFKGVKNARSFISVDNLADFILTCITNNQVKNETFVISDGDDVSLPELLKILAVGMEKNIRLFYFPSIVMRVLLTIIGKQNIYNQLYGSLTIDSTKAKKLLNWQAPKRAASGLSQTASEYKRGKKC